MDEICVPPGLAEQAMRAGKVSRQEVAIRLIEDERYSVPPRHGMKTRDQSLRVDGARRIVRRDERDRFHALVDQGFGGGGIGQKAVFRIAGESPRFDAEHPKRHLMVEIPG